jgi:ABC-2 type transport system permease protein
MWALYAREVKRFQKIFLDTVFSPIVSLSLYLAVFGVVTGNRIVAENVNYIAFVYAGLLCMNMVNSSFANPGFALIISKQLGSIIDLQITPIKSWQIGIAYALAALTRGIITLAIAVFVTIWFVPGMHILHPLQFIPALLLTGFIYGSIGVIFGMWGKNFEFLTVVTTFILQPMIFLAGVFYPITSLPQPWSTLSEFNPIHHSVNLIRYTLLGYADAPPTTSWVFLIIFAIVLFAIMTISTKRNIKS